MEPIDPDVAFTAHRSSTRARIPWWMVVALLVLRCANGQDEAFEAMEAVEPPAPPPEFLCPVKVCVMLCMLLLDVVTAEADSPSCACRTMELLVTEWPMTQPPSRQPSTRVRGTSRGASWFSRRTGSTCRRSWW